MTTGAGSYSVSDLTPARAIFLAKSKCQFKAQTIYMPDLGGGAGHTDFNTKALQPDDEDIRRAHPLHRFMTKHIAERYHQRMHGGQIMNYPSKHLQLSTVQRLVDLPVLDRLHSLLWVVNLHLGVLDD